MLRQTSAVAKLELLERVESWLQILDDSSYYELLGLLEIADETAIQAAFHEFSGAFHPDLHRGESEAIRQAITKIYQRGAEAYGVLRDPPTRAQYDLALAQGHLRLNPGYSPTSSSTSSADLAALARTPGGQLHARQFLRALGAGEVEESTRFLRKMLLAEDPNPALQKRAEELLEQARQGSFLSS